MPGSRPPRPPTPATCWRRTSTRTGRSRRASRQETCTSAWPAAWPPTRMPPATTTARCASCCACSNATPTTRRRISRSCSRWSTQAVTARPAAPSVSTAGAWTRSGSSRPRSPPRPLLRRFEPVAASIAPDGDVPRPRVGPVRADRFWVDSNVARARTARPLRRGHRVHRKRAALRLARRHGSGAAGGGQAREGGRGGAIPRGLTRAGVRVRPRPELSVARELPADGRIIDAVELADRVKQDLTVRDEGGREGPCRRPAPRPLRAAEGGQGGRRRRARRPAPRAQAPRTRPPPPSATAGAPSWPRPRRPRRELIEAYLPAELSDDELRAIVADARRRDRRDARRRTWARS